jgi:methionyl-tRNA formyltransferase
MKKLKIVYAGTPEFAVPCLKKIHSSKHELLCVLTQPDRPAGRGMKLQQSAVKKYALEENIQCLQPELIDDVLVNIILDMKPDLCIVAAYGIILPRIFLEVFSNNIYNIHASILPKWRGAAPIQRAIQNGDNEMGVSIMQIVEKLDAGDVFKIRKVERDSNLTSKDYFPLLSEVGASLMMDHINEISSGEILSAQKQDEEGVTFAHKIKKKEGLINLDSLSIEVINKILAFNPYPTAKLIFRNKGCKILKAKKSIIEEVPEFLGQIITSNGLHIGFKDKYIQILLIQHSADRPIPLEKYIVSAIS